MRLTTAQAKDLPALRALWMRCFGDDENYVNLYFEHSFHPERVFVLRVQDKPVSMAISFPVTWHAGRSVLPGAYLYAVCTAPECRRNGYFRAIMDFSEKTLASRGCAFVCLKPGSAALCQTYERMGYQPAFTNLCAAIRADNSCVSLSALSPGQYASLRSAALSGARVVYTEEYLSHQARLGTLFSAQAGQRRGIGAAEHWGGTLIVKEYLGDAALLPGICAAFGAETMQARMPGAGQVFALAKPLTDVPCPSGYFGLAFD